MTEHVYSRKYVPSTKSISFFGILWNRSRLSIFEPSAIVVTTSFDDHLGGHNTHFKEKTTNRYTLSLCCYQPQRIANGENSDVRYPYEMAEEICIPGRSQTRGRKEKSYKNGDSHRNET